MRIFSVDIHFVRKGLKHSKDRIIAQLINRTRFLPSLLKIKIISPTRRSRRWPRSGRMLEHKRIIIRRCRSGSRMAAGWTRRGVCTVERIRRSLHDGGGGGATLSCTWPSTRMAATLWRNSRGEGVCVHAGQCTQPGDICAD